MKINTRYVRKLISYGEGKQRHFAIYSPEITGGSWQAYEVDGVDEYYELLNGDLIESDGYVTLQEKIEQYIGKSS